MTDDSSPSEPPPNDPDAWVRTHRATYERMAVDYTRRIDDYAAADEAERFTRLAAPTPHVVPRILDAGCGPGRDATLLRLAGAEVLGLDIARAMLHQARQIDDAGFLCQGDFRRLPFAPASFDAVWCFAALGHLPPAAIPHALTEFRRVLDHGWLYLVVRQGSGIRATSWDGSLPRYFTDLTPETLTTALHTANFTIHHQTTHPTPPNPLAPHHRPGTWECGLSARRFGKYAKVTDPPGRRELFGLGRTSRFSVPQQAVQPKLISFVLGRARTESGVVRQRGCFPTTSETTTAS